jgi:hypothetical protein
MKEITYITDHLPAAPSADSTAAEVSRQGTIEWMVETLKEISISPSAIPELIQRIVEQHTKSLVVPGTPVGITAAEAVGATTTQMTLNTFHTSGSAKSASFGIDAMRDLIFARKNPKNESCTIYFTDKTATYEQVLDSRHYIVGSVVEDFIKDYDIDSPQVFERYWWHDTAYLLEKQIPASTKVLRLFLNVPEMFKHNVSISDLAAVLEREVPPSVVTIYGPIGDGIIDVYPHPAIVANTLKDREKGAVPPELAEITYLETIVRPDLKNIRVKGIAGIRQLYPVVSPIWRMVLQERKLSDRDLQDDNFRNALGQYIGNAWMLFYNRHIMRITGLDPENLAALCQLAGLTIIPSTPDRLNVTMPNDRFRTSSGDVVVQINGDKYKRIGDIVQFDNDVYKEISSDTIEETPNGWIEEIDNNVFVEIPHENIRQINEKFYRKILQEHFLELDGLIYEQITDPRIKITELKPSEYVAEKISADKRARRAEIKRITDETFELAKNLPEEERKAMIRKPVDVPRTRLMEASEFVMAETEGSNLKDLLAQPGIDKRRTTCNNMYTIASTLGIEAARTFLIRALNNTIANTGSYVHPANIMFIAEFITSRGEPYGATYTGISRQPGGHLSLATLERAGKVFTTNALHGRKEDIRNVSASVAVGTRMAIGNGSFDIAQNIIEDGQGKTIINDDLFTAMSRDDTARQLADTRMMAEIQPQTITPDELAGAIDMFKTINLGEAFDRTGAEDETNLLTAFNPGEFIPDITGPRTLHDGTPQKVVRRVNPQAKSPAPAPNVPRELIDVLTQIEIGVPLEGIEKITISPLEKGVAPILPQPEPVITTGLIPLSELIPEPTGTGIPTELEDMFAQFMATEEPKELPEIQTVVQDLPRADIPQLPDLEGFNVANDLIELRREQIRDLEPINIAAFQATRK